MRVRQPIVLQLRREWFLVTPRLSMLLAGLHFALVLERRFERPGHGIS